MADVEAARIGTRRDRPSGSDILRLDAVDSTMEAARARLEGLSRPLWILARSQTAGRGRHGRIWSSPPGNLYATWLSPFGAPMAEGPRLGFVAGLAVHDAVAQVAGLAWPRLALKWPNDLLIDGAKCAGLLLEGHGGAGRSAIAIGFGVNVASAPEGLPYATTTLAAHASPDATCDLVEALFIALDACLMARRDQLDAEGFDGVRRDWLARAHGFGGPIVATRAGARIAGRFADLDPGGRLIVATEAATVAIDAGDVFFPNPNAADPAA